MENNDLVKEIHKDVKELSVTVRDMKSEQAVLTYVIREHERRSIALEQRQDTLGVKLEERLAPIQKHVDIVSLLLKGAGAVAITLVGKLILDLLHLL